MNFIFVHKRKQANYHVVMLSIQETLKQGKSCLVPVISEESAARFRDKLKYYKIECDITESWDPTKDGLSSHGHMTHVYDELTGEVHKTKWADEKPTLRALILKPLTQVVSNT